MGSRLAKRCAQVCAGEPGLTTTDKYALHLMASASLDSRGRNTRDPLWTYWGGHAELGLLVFGLGVKPENRRRAIKRTLRRLEDRKLIALDDDNPGGRRSWRILPGDPAYPGE